MKKKVLDIFIYGSLIVSVVSFGYNALPEHIQDLMPNFNWLTSLLLGGTTGLFGAGGMAVTSILTKERARVDELVHAIVESFKPTAELILELEEVLKGLKFELEQVKGEKNRENFNVNKIIKDITDVKELLMVLVKSKDTNPFLDDDIKDLIKGVLENDEEAKTDI